VHWEAQRGRFPRDPRLGHRPGLSYMPSAESRNQTLPDLYSTSDGFISLSNNCSKSRLDKNSNVIILGGSVAMGLGASSNATTIASYLNTLLAENFINLQVVNAACSAYCSWQELIKFALELSRFEPPIVFSISSYNDFVHASIGDRYTGQWHLNHDRSIEDLSDYLIGLNEDISITQVIKRKLLKYPLIRTMYTNYSSSFKRKNLSEGEVGWGYADSTFTNNKLSPGNYLHNMNQIRCLVEGYGGIFINVQQPLPALSIDSHMCEDYVRLCTIHKELDSSLKGYYSTLNNLDIDHLLVTYDNFDTSEFADHCHLNDKGQKKLAFNLFDLIQNSFKS
jgi:hypothetical protein